MKVPKEITRLVIYTSQYKIIGDYHIQPGSRLSDNLNVRNGREFLPITNAEIFSVDGKKLTQAPFMQINKRHIVMVFLFTGAV